MSSSRELEFLPLKHLREIDIEEVEVQASLDDTSRHCDRINDTLRKVPVYPIRDIEGPVDA